MQNARALRLIFLSSFLFFAHLALVMYINSTVLNRIVGSTVTSALYVLGAAGSIVLLFCLPHIVKRVGLVAASVGIFTLLAASMFLLGIIIQPAVVVTVFVSYSALTATVWYCNDMFVSHYAKTAVMGHTRGTYLTINNTAIALMPVIAGAIIIRTGFHTVYILASLLLLAAAWIIHASQQSFRDRPYETPDIASAWNKLRISPPLRRVAVVNFLLQFFYAIMVIYSPLYLLQVAHFQWNTIGAIFTIMLLAFVIMQYPVGVLSDRIGQKKLLILGLLIAGGSTIAFGLLGSGLSVLLCIIVLFCTRIGASMTEVLSESYFFKQVNDRDEGLISIYRMMYPLSYIIAPLVGWLIVSRTSYGMLFVILGAILVAGAIYCLRLADIR